MKCNKVRLVHSWDELLDRARADARRIERARERWLGQQARESASLVGTLLDLAEGSVRVAIRVEGGHRLDGVVILLGTDVVVVDDAGEHVAAPIDAVAVVRPVPGDVAPVAAGDRPAVADITFAEVLGRLADDGPRVALGLRDGELVAGTLAGAGADVLSVRIAPGAGGIVYVSVAAVSVVRLG